MRLWSEVTFREVAKDLPPLGSEREQYTRMGVSQVLETKYARSQKAKPKKELQKNLTRKRGKRRTRKQMKSSSPGRLSTRVRLRNVFQGRAVVDREKENRTLLNKASSRNGELRIGSEDKRN